MSHTSSIEIVNMSAEESISIIGFDKTYRGDALKQRVCEILGMNTIKGWSIVDTVDHLVLVHYNDSSKDPDVDLSVCGKLRGVLVDTEAGAIVANSFGYTPTAVCDELSEIDGTINLTDTDGIVHSFNTSECLIKRVFEGVVIRVIWHKGELYRLTHKKIKPLKSRWGNSIPFIQMYEQAGGPTAEQLFDTSKPYSDTCYVFLVSHPALLVGTRQNVTAPYIVHLAQYRMNINRPSDEISPGLGNFTLDTNISGVVTESFIHDPKSLSLEEANHHLKYGYYNEFQVEDTRQLTGEAVIIYRMENGEVADIVKVHSKAYDWRVNLRGNNHNINNQFYILLNKAYPDINTPAKWEAFQENFITLPLYDEQALKDLYYNNNYILTLPSDNVTQHVYRSRDSRIHLLWMNYLLSLPSSVQGEGLNILSQFKKDRTDLINWLQQIESTVRDIEKHDFPAITAHKVSEDFKRKVIERIKGIINSSRRLARERMANGGNYSAKGSYMKLPTLIKSTIRNLINKEDGPSLYKLIRAMKLSRTPVPTTASVTPISD